MYYKDIVCKSCGKVLARMNKTVVVSIKTKTLCFTCANSRHSNQQPTSGKAS